MEGKQLTCELFHSMHIAANRAAAGRLDRPPKKRHGQGVQL